jgi:hypothetical protein
MQRRVTCANDPLNLLSVDPGANRQKGRRRRRDLASCQ